MKYFASCSFGKDSVATVLLALEHNEPLDEKDLKSISADISAEQLHRLYDRLEDEAKPYALRVGRSQEKHRAVTIYCDAENVAYFQNIIDHEI